MPSPLKANLAVFLFHAMRSWHVYWSPEPAVSSIVDPLQLLTPYRLYLCYLLLWLPPAPTLLVLLLLGTVCCAPSAITCPCSASVAPSGKQPPDRCSTSCRVCACLYAPDVSCCIAHIISQRLKITRCLPRLLCCSQWCSTPRFEGWCAAPCSKRGNHAALSHITATHHGSDEVCGGPHPAWLETAHRRAVQRRQNHTI
jgi:hypothetical protein